MKKNYLTMVFLFSITFCKGMGQANMSSDTVKEIPNQKILMLPLILYSPETRWGIGLAGAYFFKVPKKNNSSRTSDVNIALLYTQREQILAAIGSNLFFDKENKIFRFHGSYSIYPDKYWGIGNYTSKDEMVKYSLEQFYLNPQFLVRQFSKFYVGVSYEFQNLSDFNFEINTHEFSENDVLSRTGGNTSGIGALITWDTRNNAFAPDNGFFGELNISTYKKILGSDYSFTSFTLDIRKFISLNKNQVIAFQALMKLNKGIVPFRNHSFLGGSDMMRGYYRGRFADSDMMAYQAELRQHLFWRIGVTGFAAVGQVSEDYGDFRFSGFHFAYGGGLRFMLRKSEKLNLRIDYGRGNHSDGLYILLKEAF